MKILQRRQIRIEDPGVRAQVATTLTTVSQYSDLLALYQQDSEISNHLQTLAQNNIAQFAQFSSEVSQLVDTIELRNQHGLAHLEKASARGQYSLLLLGMVSLCALILILWRVVYRSVTRPLAEQTQALQRLLDGDIDSFPGNRWRTGAGYHRAADGCVSQQCSCTESPPRTAGGAGQSAYS